MATVHGWINIYRSGFYHSEGKIGAYDRHPGDVYASEDAARFDIHPQSHYIATVPVSWEEATIPRVNEFTPVASADHEDVELADVVNFREVSPA